MVDPPLTELRIYEVAPGRFDDLRDRFERLALPLFLRHGFKVDGPWWFEDAGGERIVYLLKWDSASERERLLKSFRADPEWIQGLEASEREGPLTERITANMLEPLMK